MGGRTVNYRIKEEMRKNIARIYPEKETRRRKKKGKKEGEGFTNRNGEKE